MYSLILKMEHIALFIQTKCICHGSFRLETILDYKKRHEENMCLTNKPHGNMEVNLSVNPTKFTQY